MKTHLLFGISVFAVGVARAAAGEAASLPDQVLALQQAVARLQSDYEARISALTMQVQRQQAQIEALTIGAGRVPPIASTPGVVATPPAVFSTSDNSLVAANTTMFPTTDEMLTGTIVETAADRAEAMPAAPTNPGGPKGSYMNVSFDAVATFAASTSNDLASLEVGDHDPQQRGFNLRNQELALSGAVDPYFEGAANIVFKLDNFNETETEVEEAFLQTTSLSHGLQVKAGQFFAPFGRINPTHPHTWDFVDAPLVAGRFLGPDGLRGAGAQLAWLAPWSWYSQFLVSMQNGRGGTAYFFRNPGDDGTFFSRPTIDRDVQGSSDFVWTGRWENSLDLSPTQTVVLGASLARGPNNTGDTSSTELQGLDFFYKWKPHDAFGGWPFVKWQTEMLWSRYEAGRGAADAFPVAEVFHDRGFYTQLVWGFAKQWTAGVRGDWLDYTDSTFTDDVTRQNRRRASAALTWYPTEFSKLRLQYNHDQLLADGFHDADSADSLFLQTEIVLGAHGAHKF